MKQYHTCLGYFVLGGLAFTLSTMYALMQLAGWSLYDLIPRNIYEWVLAILATLMILCLLMYGITKIIEPIINNLD